jgi:hypothetical protein
MTVRPVVWIGIDAGKVTHHAAAVGEQGRVGLARAFDYSTRSALILVSGYQPPARCARPGTPA